MNSQPHTNRLVREKSPYLLQHAHNPVDWYPWGEEAFEKAKKGNKPIFLSIGYSTCHWCHVMERESFENEAIAKVMNEHFVCIKVDREERPDVDQIYMNAVMLLTGQGGWPLNLFLTPDLKPFYGGTYFAPDGRYGRPGFPAVLEDVSRAWRTKPVEVEKAGQQLAEAISRSGADMSGGPLNENLLDLARQQLESGFDPKDGGFRGAPKFPPAMALQFLLRLNQKTGDKKIMPLVEVTLDKMSQGGIYDQVGGGFSRYSTDDEWLVPHFEKMLYDNALLSRAYLEAYQVTGNEEYARVARETFSYLFRDMTDANGGFYSAEDADSEGEEGKFYVWTPSELKRILGDEAGLAFCELYNASEGGNFEGQNILNLKGPLAKSLKALGQDVKWWEAAKSKVLAERSKRVRPHLDDKILTAWNSLMISSLCYGFQILGEAQYLKAAEKASNFIDKNLFKNGRLLASYRQGPSDIQGYIDDYSFYQAAQLDLYESTFQTSYLNKAIELEKEMNRLFWDGKNGGYFFTGIDQKDAHRLLARTKDSHDGVIPSGNSLSALSLYRLAEFTGDQKYRNRADEILKAFSVLLSQGAVNFPQMLQAFQYDFYGPAEIFVVGPRQDSQALLALLWKTFLPQKVLVFSEESQLKELARFIPWVEDRKCQGNKPTVYICRNYQCQLPTTEGQKAMDLLGIH